jgi:drug/metabolite transporter (DMT)-like permease
MTKSNYKILPWVVLVAGLGGGIPPFTKIALEVFPTFSFVFFRFLIASVILIPIFLRSKEKIAKNEIPFLFLISLLGTANVLFAALGLQKTSATIAQVMYAIVPIIALIASSFILKTRFYKEKIIGVLLGFIGVLIIILAPNMANISNNLGTIIGNLLILTAVFCYSFYTVFSKKIQKKYSPLALTTLMIITTLIVQSFLITTEITNYPETFNHLTIKGIIGLLYVGIIGTAFFFLLYQKVIKRATPLIASMVFYLQPVFTFLWAYFLLGERLTLSLIIGSLLAFLGAGLVSRENNKNSLKNTFELMDQAKGNSKGKKWKREDLYQSRINK